MSVLERDTWFYLLGARTGPGVESGFSGVFSQVWKQCKGKAEKAQTCPRGWGPGGVLGDGDVEACLRVLRHRGAFLTGPLGKSESLGGLVGTLLQGARMSQLLCPVPLISSGPARGRWPWIRVPTGMNVLDSPQTQLLQNLVSLPPPLQRLTLPLVPPWGGKWLRSFVKASRYRKTDNEAYAGG